MYVLLVRLCYHLCSRQHRLRRSYCLVHPLSNKWMLEDDLCLLIHTWDCRKTQGTKLKSYCWCCKWDTSLDGKPLYCKCMQLRMYILYNNVCILLHMMIIYIFTYVWCSMYIWCFVICCTWSSSCSCRTYTFDMLFQGSCIQPHNKRYLEQAANHYIYIY